MGRRMTGRRREGTEAAVGKWNGQWRERREGWEKREEGEKEKGPTATWRGKWNYGWREERTGRRREGGDDSEAKERANSEEPQPSPGQRSDGHWT